MERDGFKQRAETADEALFQVTSHREAAELALAEQNEDAQRAHIALKAIYDLSQNARKRIQEFPFKDWDVTKISGLLTSIEQYIDAARKEGT